MALKELAKEIHQNAVDHGWWDTPRSVSEILCLIHSEISEALEEDRNHHAPNETYYSGKVKKGNVEVIATFDHQTAMFHNNDHILVNKPEGIPSELADAIIRILDFCEHYGIDIDSAIREKMEFNKTRPYRHGGKKS